MVCMLMVPNLKVLLGLIFCDRRIEDVECGERGYLEGLASRYADLFNTHYGDVLDHLEELRRREWEEMSPRIRVLSSTTPDTPTSPSTAAPGSHGLTTSHSQPIYVPGKYSPSSCLSDKEEDEIYGFGYGVYGKQMLQRHQHHQMIISPQVHQHSCLSPRSAFFYEFPPSEHGHQTNKKKTSFSRFLRGLKTGHRKDKHSPRHSRAGCQRRRRMGTPDSVDSMLPSIVDPRDYDRLRFMQMNGGAPNSFEETIHRLKVQEVLKKRERINKEHEEILRDIRQGLLQINREGGRTVIPGDDTYMYDDDARCSGLGPHWYDEPPYESDPEDFLMGGQPVPTATIQNGRVCFTLNLRQEPRGEGVISLPTAGDISIPRDPSVNGNGAWLPQALHQPSQGSAGGSSLTARGSARRGLLVHPSGPYPATIIPLSDSTHSRTSRDRESGDYASSDVQSIGSRLSTMSIETSRSEQMDVPGALSSAYLTAASAKGHQFHKLSRSSASEEGLSASHSSDYEDQDELQTVQHVTVHATESGSRGGVSLVGRMRGLRQDVQKKISRLRPVGATTPSGSGDGTETRVEAFPSTSSAESLPSGSGSSTQALVPAGSNHSSLSAEDCDTTPTLVGPPIGKARALVDYTPSPYDKDALRFKKGDIIDIVAMNPSGLWRGVCHKRIGNFKFINVEILTDKRRRGVSKYSHCGVSRGKPQSVEELLQRINLEEHISVFVLNGYEDLELFKDLEGEDLDYLGISNPEHRAKILTAVELLHDYDSPESLEDTDVEGPASSSEDEDGQHSFRRLHFPRDSGCYEASVKERFHTLHHRHHHKMQHHHHRSSTTGHKQPMCDKAGGQASEHMCGGNNIREIPNNLDSGLVALKHPLLLQCNNTSGDNATVPNSDGQFSSVPAASQITLPRQGSTDLAEKQLPLAQQQNFLPNIPVTSIPAVSPVSSVDQIKTSASSSPVRTSVEPYVVARGKLVSVDPNRRAASPSVASPVGSIRSNCKKQPQQALLESPSSRRSPSSNIFSCTTTTNADISPVLSNEISSSPPPCGVIEDSCETNPKLTMVKYVVGGSSDLGLGCESGNIGIGSGGGRGCSFSEKSSDSGVSSSSLSSANPRENCSRKEGRSGHIIVSSTGTVIESPTRGFITFGCVGNNRSSPTSANLKNQQQQNLVFHQGADKNSSYQ
ncbi:uncharacterized protein [Anabrus simplex]|uniref:uncharacterized protein n=1 Tax=Anabrus simplex TaxID=316456 RepID=UPI0035A39D78